MSHWLLLIHHLPPKPDYLRVKVRRRLQRVGALALKNSVYVLPRREDTLEDLQWVLSEIRDQSGEGAILDAKFLHGPSDEELEARFRGERDEEYVALAREARAAARGTATEAELARLRRRMTEIARLDFFGAERRAEAEREIGQLETTALSRSDRAPEGALVKQGMAESPLRGATWVTRAGIFVDRIASAWLIKRFIDPAASFRFVDGVRHDAAPGELRFDMLGAEYTHVGDRCTFEVLLERFELRDPSLESIGRIVHDIDLKDDKYGSPEVPGVLAILTGIARAHADDSARLAAGQRLFDALYSRAPEASA